MHRTAYIWIALLWQMRPEKKKKNAALVSWVLVVGASYPNLIASASSPFLSFSTLFSSNIVYYYFLLKPWLELMESWHSVRIA